jgi:hypothetical protein
VSNEDSIRVVQVMCGEAPRHLMMCPTNCGGHAGRVVGHVKHDWCGVLQCGICHSEWNIICVACSSGYGSHLRTGRAIMDHTRLKSQIITLNAPKESLEPYKHSPGKTVTTLQDLTDFGSVLHPRDEAMDEAVLVVNSPSNFAELVQRSQVSTRQPTFDFASDENNTFFQHEKQGNGASYLVSNCCFQSKKEVVKTLENDHRYHLAMAYHVNTLSRQQQQLFVNLIDYTMVMTEDFVKVSHTNENVPSHLTHTYGILQDQLCTEYFNEGSGGIREGYSFFKLCWKSRIYEWEVS